MHAELKLRESVLMLSPECPERQGYSAKTLGNTPSTLYLLVEDVDKVTKQATSAGATLIQPPTDMFWGDRTAMLVDSDGNKWMLATHKSEPTPQQMESEMKKMAADSFDFIMIDADKPNYVNYLAEALRLVKPGGVIAGDNALAWGKIGQSQISASDPDYKSVTSIQAFNRAFASEKAIFGVITPVGDGLALGVVEK